MILMARKSIPFTSYFYFVFTIRAVQLSSLGLYKYYIPFLSHHYKIWIMIVHVTVNLKPNTRRITMPKKHVV